MKSQVQNALAPPFSCVYSPNVPELSIDVASSANDMAIDAIFSDFGTNFSVGSGQTVLADNLASQSMFNPKLSTSYELSTGNTTTMSWTNSGGTGILTQAACNLQSAGTLLPVELISFRGQASQQDVELTWTTATELNNEGFEVEHRTEDPEWRMLYFVAGNGTSLEERYFSFLHTEDTADFNYYRLKQLDFDGQFEYSNIVTVQLEGKPAVFQIYPNPTDDFVTIESNKIGAIVQITNVQGQVVQEFELVESKVQHSINHLAEGVYFIKVGDDVRRVIIQK